MTTLIPLQQPILFSGVELAILLLVEIIIAAVVGRWIYYDAQSRGSKWAWQWGVGIAILLVFLFVPGLVVLMFYLLTRGEKRHQSGPSV